MTKRIFIFSSYNDHHVAAIFPFLKINRDLNIVESNSHSIKKQSLSMLSNDMCLVLNGKKVIFNESDVIWYRKPQAWIIKPRFTPKQIISAKFKRNEAVHLIKEAAILAAKSGAFIINNPPDVLDASNKLTQLQIAAQIGFKIPDTICTNDVDELKVFIQSNNGNAISKAMSHSGVSFGKTLSTIYTYEITEQDLEKYEGFEYIDYPLFLQERIEKSFELRIIVIGEKIFGCRIDSQLNNNSRTDLRRVAIDSLPHSPFKLPPKVEEYCFKICKHYNLQFGAIDMAVTPEGEYVFFEINPNGQYLWIEEMTGMPLSQAMANLLAEPAKYMLK